MNKHISIHVYTKAAKLLKLFSLTSQDLIHHKICWWGKILETEMRWEWAVGLLMWLWKWDQLCHPTPHGTMEILSSKKKASLKDETHGIMGRAGVTLKCPEMMKQFWKTESRWDYVDRNEGNLSPTCVQKMPRMLRSAAEKPPSPLPAITEAEGGPSANRKVITELPTEPLSQWL